MSFSSEGFEWWNIKNNINIFLDFQNLNNPSPLLPQESILANGCFCPDVKMWFQLVFPTEPSSGNTFNTCWWKHTSFLNLKLYLEHKCNIESPEIHYCQTPIFWFHILFFPWFYTVLSARGQMRFKNIQPAYFQWMIDYGLIFWCNLLVQVLFLFLLQKKVIRIMVAAHLDVHVGVCSGKWIN